MDLHWIILWCELSLDYYIRISSGDTFLFFSYGVILRKVFLAYVLTTMHFILCITMYYYVFTMYFWVYGVVFTSGDSS